MVSVETWLEMYEERIDSAEVRLNGGVDDALVMEDLHMAVEGLVKGCYKHVHDERPPDNHNTPDIVEKIPILDRQVSNDHKKLLNYLRDVYGKRYPNDLPVVDLDY